MDAHRFTPSPADRMYCDACGEPRLTAVHPRRVTTVTKVEPVKPVVAEEPEPVLTQEPTQEQAAVEQYVSRVVQMRAQRWDDADLGDGERFPDAVADELREREPVRDEFGRFVATTA